jgi:hypothetical protein
LVFLGTCRFFWASLKVAGFFVPGCLKVARPLKVEKSLIYLGFIVADPIFCPFFD